MGLPILLKAMAGRELSTDPQSMCAPVHRFGCRFSFLVVLALPVMRRVDEPRM